MHANVPPSGPRGTNSSAIEIDRGDGYAIARFQRVVIITIRTTITADAIRRAVAASNRIIDEYGSVASLMIVGPGWKMPGSDVMDAAKETTASAQEQFVCTSNVILGGGFVASTIRSMLTMMESIYAKKHRHQETVDDLAKGVAWIVSRLEETPEFSRDLTFAALPYVDFAKRA